MCLTFSSESTLRKEVVWNVFFQIYSVDPITIDHNFCCGNIDALDTTPCKQITFGLSIQRRIETHICFVEISDVLGSTWSHIPKDPCMVYLPCIWSNFYGFHVGKYTVRVMDPMGIGNSPELGSPGNMAFFGQLKASESKIGSDYFQPGKSWWVDREMVVF